MRTRAIQTPATPTPATPRSPAPAPALSRSERARADVLAAVYEVLLEDGAVHLTIDAVSARSGVAKTTIYRHWPSKAALVHDAVVPLLVERPAPDTGDLRSDLLTLFGKSVCPQLEGPLGGIVMSLLDEARRDPELDALLARTREDQAKPLQTVLARAQARGEIPPRADLHQVAELLLGPFVFRRLSGGVDLDTRFVRFVVNTVLDGLNASRGATSAKRR